MKSTTFKIKKNTEENKKAKIKFHVICAYFRKQKLINLIVKRIPLTNPNPNKQV